MEVPHGKAGTQEIPVSYALDGRCAPRSQCVGGPECTSCHRQTSVTAGTILHGSKLDLTVWFWAAYLMATHSNGISALQLQKQLALGSYRTAWMLAAKLRRAMVDPDRNPLSGLVEIDETSLPFRTKNDPAGGGPGRSHDGKLLVVGGIEVGDGNKPGRLRLAALTDYGAGSLNAFIARKDLAKLRLQLLPRITTVFAHVHRLKEKQLRMIAVSWGDLSDALARGDVAVTFGGWEAMKKFAADAGSVIEYPYPKEGTTAWLDNFCVAKDAPNWEIDHAICNQIIGVPAQVKIGSEFVQGIVNTEAIAALDDASRALYPYDDPVGMTETMTFYNFPPLEDDGVHTTYDDWIKEWERFKAA